jgi:hypothetical protein
LGGCAIAAGLRARAQEIPAGWSVETKPKGAILTYAPEKDGRAISSSRACATR